MISLYDFQQVALALIVAAFQLRSAVLAVMATGLGKTIVAAFWAKQELEQKQKGLFLCHDNGILDQAMIEFRKVFGDQYDLRAFYGDKKDWDADKADMVFASFQTYNRWKGAFFEDEFDFIIVVESYHGQAPTFKEVILYFKPKKLLGITATPDRMDLKDIREIFGEEVVNYTLEESIANGWLTPIEYHILNDSLNHWKLKWLTERILESGQRVSIKQVNETIFIKRRDEEIAKIIQEYAGSVKKTIVFCEATEHAEHFQQFLPNSVTYHSRLKGGRKECRRRLAEFRKGTVQFILAVDKFNEGIDVPDAEVIVFLRCTDSKTIFYQQLGRGLRKLLGKLKVTILDFVANCERLTTLKEMAEKVNAFTGNGLIFNKDLLHVSGDGFDFVFSDDLLDVLTIIRRIKGLVIADFDDLLKFYAEENDLPASEAVANLHLSYYWRNPECGHVWNASVRKRREQPDWYCPLCAQSRLDSSYGHGIFEAEFSMRNSITPQEVYIPRDYMRKFWWKCRICSTEYEEFLWKKIAIESPRQNTISWRRCPKCAVAHRVGKYNYYPDFYIAMQAAYLLGIETAKDYREKRKLDPELPPDPVNWYKCPDFWKMLKMPMYRLFSV